jgi:hypothetical protein
VLGLSSVWTVCAAKDFTEKEACAMAIAQIHKSFDPAPNTPPNQVFFKVQNIVSCGDFSSIMAQGVASVRVTYIFLRATPAWNAQRITDEIHFYRTDQGWKVQKTGF